MNKEINPWVAFAIIIIFCIPLSFRFWLAGEAAAARINVFFLQLDVDNGLSMLIDEKLISYDGVGDEAIVNLSSYGVVQPMGNIDYLSNGNVLLRKGEPVSGFSQFLRSIFHSKPAIEVLPDISNITTGTLMSCNLYNQSCSAYSNIILPRQYRMLIDRYYGGFFISEGTTHSVSKYNSLGILQGSTTADLRYPKRLRAHDDSLYVVDTHHGRIVTLANDSFEFGDVISEEFVVALDQDTYTRPLDVLKFGDSWWVINAPLNLFGSQLHRFNEDWQFVEVVELPDGADPYDLAVYNNRLLVADIEKGNIYQFSNDGQRVEDLHSESLNSLFLQAENEKNYYEGLIFRTYIVMGLMVIIGFFIAIIVARKHDKEVGDPYKRKLLNRTIGVTLQGKTMLISNIEMVPGQRVIEHLGLVQGSTVRAKHVGKDIMASLKNIFGGELSGYTDLLQESRDEAIARMSEQAQSIGANGVINVRFATSAIAAGASEILAYGTAVILEEK